MPGASNLPNYLIDRFKGWRNSRFVAERAWFTHLAEGGQRPRTMVISCCDSRVDVNMLFGAEPGEMFVLRNVASLVPPYESGGGLHGASAAIEYAVRVLKVAHLLVLGHSQCGGVAACHDLCAGHDLPIAHSSEFVVPWLDILRPAYQNVLSLPDDRSQRIPALEREGVLTSLRNLQTFPFIAEAMSADRLTIHGAWFNIGEGQLYVYQPDTDSFVPVG